MADELWNQKLTRENIRDFYMSTVVMVYSSCYGITKEATRCENAIVKSYLDIYSKRNNVPADKVIYEFGDILLENSKNIVTQYPLPADLTFEDRQLDEYTRNSMLEKILDALCSQEIQQKNDRILELQNRLNMATLAASQVAQTQQIIEGLTPVA